MSSRAEIQSAAATLEMIDDIGLITLRRPHVMNAVNAALSEAVGDALEQVDSDPRARVAVITGEGRAFCAGADLKGIAAGESLTSPSHPEWGFGGLVEHPTRKPLIAAVNGVAMGGGAEIVLACDLAVMSEEATLGLPEVKRGLFAAAGGLIRLPRQLPLKIALEAALTGTGFDARTALQWGIVNRIVPTTEVLPAAMELARTIARNAPLALEASKRMIHASSGTGSEWDAHLWAMQGREIARLLATRDAIEGSTAFTEKRVPTWTGE